MAVSKDSKRARPPMPPMDDLTAIAFAREAFERLHPLATQPPWLRRYSTSGTVRRDADHNFIVGFVWQPKRSTSGAERFFEVRINAWTAETFVLFATPLDKYTENELEEYL